MKASLRILLVSLGFIGSVAYSQVTTSPSVTGVAAPQSSVAITGGTINGATVGATTPAAVTATTLTATTFTLGGVSVLPILSGTTTSIGGGALLAGACTSGTVAVTNSTTAMAVIATPATYPGDGAEWTGYVSTNGTVTVKVCALVGLTPTASNYNVRVIQ